MISLGNYDFLEEILDKIDQHYKEMCCSLQMILRSKLLDVEWGGLLSLDHNKIIVCK